MISNRQELVIHSQQLILMVGARSKLLRVSAGSNKELVVSNYQLANIIRSKDLVFSSQQLVKSNQQLVKSSQ